MDERIKSGYQKIYSELFHIILIACCLSLVFKIVFLGLQSKDCIPEFPIMVGSPIYLVIRSRMLGITQPGAFPDQNSWKKYLALLSGLCGFFLVFILTAIRHGKHADLPAALGSGVIFAVSYLIAHGIFQKLEQRRQKKLDSQYDEK